MGRDLYANTIAMHEWADRWLVDKQKKPLVLRHISCGNSLQSELVCGECEGPLKPKNVTYDRELRRRKAG